MSRCLFCLFFLCLSVFVFSCFSSSDSYWFHVTSVITWIDKLVAIPAHHFSTHLIVRSSYSVWQDFVAIFTLVKFSTDWVVFFVGLAVVGITFVSSKHSMTLSTLLPWSIFIHALATYCKTTLARFVAALVFFPIITLLTIKAPMVSSEKAWYRSYDIIVIIAKIQINLFLSLGSFKDNGIEVFSG